MIPPKPSRKRLAYGLPPSVEAIVATNVDMQKIMAAGVNLDGSLKPEAIRALLKLKGISLRALAETHGKFDTYFHAVITRETRDAFVEDVIAGAIGMDPDRIWARQALDEKSA